MAVARELYTDYFIELSVRFLAKEAALTALGTAQAAVAAAVQDYPSVITKILGLILRVGGVITLFVGAYYTIVYGIIIYSLNKEIERLDKNLNTSDSSLKGKEPKHNINIIDQQNTTQNNTNSTQQII